jgi:hypothetical protein
MRCTSGASLSISKLYISAAANPRIWLASAMGMCQKACRSHLRVAGHVPSGWVQSLPHNMFGPPIS